MTYTILRGGRVLDTAAGTAEFADVLIEGDTIRQIGPPGCPAPEGATAASTIVICRPSWAPSRWS